DPADRPAGHPGRCRRGSGALPAPGGPARASAPAAGRAWPAAPLDAGGGRRPRGRRRAGGPGGGGGPPPGGGPAPPRGAGAGVARERAAMAGLEALATWTESLRDTIAGAVGLEQAIPASLRAAAPSLREPLTALVERLHTRVPMPEALRRFADDLADPSADL